MKNKPEPIMIPDDVGVMIPDDVGVMIPDDVGVMIPDEASSPAPTGVWGVIDKLKYWDTAIRLPAGVAAYYRDKDINGGQSQYTLEEVVDDALHMKGKTPYSNVRWGDVYTSVMSGEEVADSVKFRKRLNTITTGGSFDSMSMVEDFMMGGASDYVLAKGSFKAIKPLLSKSNKLSKSTNFTEAASALLKRQDAASVINAKRARAEEVVKKAQDLDDQFKQLDDLNAQLKGTPVYNTIQVPYQRVTTRPKIDVVKKISKDQIENEQIIDKILYRGQLKEFPDLQKVENSNIVNNLHLGKGVFTTTDLEVAKGYATDPITKEIGNIFRLQKPTTKIFDLNDVTKPQLRALGITEEEIRLAIDVPAGVGIYPPSEDTVANLLIGHYKQEGLHGYTLDEFTRWSNINDAAGELNTGQRKFGGQGVTLEDVIERYNIDPSDVSIVTDPSSSFELKKFEKVLKENYDWAIDPLAGFKMNLKTQTRNKVVEVLKGAGYKWWKHRGGLVVGDKLHDVYVAIDDDALKLVDDIKASKEPIRPDQISREGVKWTPPTEQVTETAYKDIKTLNPERKVLRADIVNKQTEVVTRLNKLVPEIRTYLDEIETPYEASLRVLKEMRGAVPDDEVQSVTKAINAELKRIRGLKKSPNSMMDDLLTMSEIEPTVVKGKKVVPNITEANKLRKVISDSVPLLNDLDNTMNELIEKHIRIGKITDKLKPSRIRLAMEGMEEVDREILGIAKQEAKEAWAAEAAGKPVKKYVDILAKALSYGEADNFRDLDLHQLRALDDILDQTLTLPKNLRFLSRAGSAFTPQNLIMRKMGLGYISEPLRLNRTHVVDQSVNDITKGVDDLFSGYRKQFKKDFSEDAEVLMTYLWEGEDIPIDLARKFNQKELDYISRTADFIRDRLEGIADVAERVGKITSDPEKAKKLGIPLREKFYYKHVRDSFDANLDIQSSWDEDLTEIMGSVFQRRAKNKPTIAKKMDISEFKSRLRDDDNFQRTNSVGIMLGAYRAELRAVYLQPLIERGAAVIGVIPDPLLRQRATREFGRFVKSIRGMEMKGDKTLNEWTRAIEDELYKGIAKISKGKWTPVARERAWERLSGSLIKQSATGTLALNTPYNVKNLIQIFHNVPIIGTKNTMTGLRAGFDKDAQRLIKYLPSMFSRIPMEGVDWSNVKQIGDNARKVSLLPTSFIERYWNGSSAAFGGIKYALQNKEGGRPFRQALAEFALENGWDNKVIDGKNLWRVLADAMENPNYAPRLQPLMEMADNVVSTTQYAYNRFDLPPVLSSSSGRLFGQFTSWGMNYFTNYIPSMINMLKTGKDINGFDITLWQRMAIFKHITLVGLVSELGGRLGFDMQWHHPVSQIATGKIFGVPVPVPVPPVTSAALNLAAGAWMQNPLTEEGRERNIMIQLGKVAFTSMEFNEIEMDRFTKDFLTRDLPTLVVPAYTQLKRIYHTLPTEDLPEGVDKFMGKKEQRSPKSLILPIKPDEKRGSAYR